MASSLLLYVDCSASPGPYTETRFTYERGRGVRQDVIEGKPSCSIYEADTGVIDEYCDGTTKVVVTHTGAGAISESRTPNSTACGFECSLSISSVSTTDETAAGQNDGTARVNVSSNTSSLRYSLDNFVTSQTSSTFSGLAPGDYIAYARTSDQKCADSMGFNIYPGPNNDNPKYRHTFTDILGTEHVLNIYQYGWTGDTTELCGGASPIQYNVSGQGEGLYSPIHATEARLNLLAESDLAYEEFFLADERDYYLEHLQDGALKFKGFILPDVYQEPYLYPPYVVEVSATCGLNLLAQEPFVYDTGGHITEILTVYDIIKLCLDKLEVELPIKVQSEKAFIFHGIKLRTKRFRREDAPWNCFEVLEAICKAFNLRIVQSEARWEIVHINTSAKETNYELYDPIDGTIIAAGTVNRNRNITRNDNPEPLFWANESQLLQYRPASKRVNVTYETGGFYSFLNGDFSEVNWDGDRLRFWEGDADYYRTKSSYQGEDYDLVINGRSSTLAAAKSLQCRPFILNQKLYIQGFYYIDCAEEVELSSKINPQIYCDIKCGNYWWNGASWQTTKIYLNLAFTGEITFNDYHRIRVGSIDEPPVADYCLVTLYQCVSADYAVNNIRIPYLHIGDDVLGSEDFDEYNHKKYNPKNYTLNHNEKIAFGIDAHELEDPKSLPQTSTGGGTNGAILDTNGLLYRKWDINKTFQEWNAGERYENYEKPGRMLTGTLMGYYELNTPIIDPLYPAISLLCTGYSHDVSACQHTGEWEEVVNDYTASYLIDYQGNYLIDYSGGKLPDYGE